MTTDLQELKRIDVKIQCLVFGFMKGSQTLLSNDSCYNTITDLIIYTVLAFYHHVEHFKHYADACWLTSNDDQTITKTADAYSSCYGSAIIPYSNKRTHVWKIKVDKVIDGNLVIGIDEANHKWCHTAFYFTQGTKSYAYARWGQKWDPQGEPVKYGSEYFTGDIIEMVLDSNNKTLLFGVNGSSPTIAFENIAPTDIGYCLAVWVYNSTAGVTLLSYKQYPSKVTDQTKIEQQLSELTL